MSLKSFAGKRIAITGGATGIGLAVARKMASDGASLALCGLEVDAIDAAKLELLEIGATSVLTTQCDVTEDGALEDWIKGVVDHFGGIDVGWNNAGVMAPAQPFQDMQWKAYQKVLSVNLDAVARGSQLFARQMIRQGTPALILNTGSENSLFNAVPGGAAYVASKMAVRGLTYGLMQDVPDFIDVKLVCPGFVKTPLGPEAVMQAGMDADRFAQIVYPQLLERGRFYVVSHGYNAVRVRERTDRLLAEIESGAAPTDETQRFDTYTLMGLDPLGRPLG